MNWGETIACLKFSGKMHSDKERLMRVVMGWRREPIHALTRHVGITSDGQEALDEEGIATFTSSGVAGRNEERGGGGEGGGECGESTVEDVCGKGEQSLTILSPKNFENEEARSD
jgi:nitrogen regulatory protein PII